MRRLDRNGIGAVGTIIIILVLLVGGFLVFSLVNKDNDVPDNVNIETPTAEEVVPDDDDLLSQIIENPDQYYGQQVTVVGEIQDLYTTRVFKISDQTVGQELLVITPEPLSEQQAAEAEELLEDNADVRVAGTVRQLVIAEVEEELSIDLDEQVEVEFRNKPVLIANNVTFSDSSAVLDFTQGPEATE